MKVKMTVCTVLIFCMAMAGNLSQVTAEKISEEAKKDKTVIIETENTDVNATTDDETADDETGEDNTEEIPLENPILHTSSRPNGKIKIKWNKTDEADEYVLFRSTKKKQWIP